jgi:hypothetical protein
MIWPCDVTRPVCDIGRDFLTQDLMLDVTRQPLLYILT